MNIVAAIQMVSTDNVADNLASAGTLIGQAADRGARLAMLPEFFPLISIDDRAKLGIGEDFGSGPIQEFLSEAAQKHGIWILGGTIPLRCDDPDRVYNSALLIDDKGDCRARYDKIHLFDVYVDDKEKESYNESATMAPGSEVVVAETPVGRVGMSACYDVRFPELYRRMVSQGVEIIAVPSAFTAKTGKRHWEVLLRARAIENLCYVVAPGQGGRHYEKRYTWGHSMIIDPWGDILCSLLGGPGVACADLDLDKLHRLRASFPALEHRTLDREN